MRAQYIVRIRIITVGVILLFTLIVVRLYFLQIVHGEVYAQAAQQQYVRSARDVFDRGKIYFTFKNNEHIAAATLKTGFLLAINPNNIENPEELYHALSKYITLDRASFLKKARKRDDPYEEVARHVDASTVEEIEKEGIKGVQFFREQWRYYPGETLGAHLLGFVGYGTNGTRQSGQYGLERYWESVLTRQEDQLYVNFFAEIFANVQDVENKDTKDRKGDIITSIEPVVQKELESALEKTQEKWKSKQIGGVVINPKTGAIYALASRPTYNPNKYGEVESANVYSNILVEDVYEMGSIIKPIAMAIGLDTGAVDAHTTYNDTGRVKIGIATISNYDGRSRGVVDMQEVLNQSLNVGMAFVAKKVGNDVMGERMKLFGFGEETGIDLPFEAHGLIDNLNSPRDVEYATAAFGQGIALTPIATVRALSALGNGGVLVTPHIATHIRYTSGREGNIEPDDTVRVISKETSEEISRMLVEVVDTALKHGEKKKEHYAIAAKTGTAQIAKPTERGYYDDRYLHSFFGYFPAYDPKFLIFLFHTEPQGARYASQTLTEPFYDLVDFLINYYEVPPDR